MRFHSTRDVTISLSAAQAITRGLSQDGGLFVPETFPQLPEGRLRELTSMDYPRRAVHPCHQIKR